MTELSARVAAWMAAEEAVHLPPLDRTDLRKGIQGLSGLYVHQRADQDLAARAGAGPARRAAFACYFAPLHLLTAVAALERHGAALGTAGRPVWDLGCGSGAAGAAVSWCTGQGPILGVDRERGWLDAAGRTWRALGLRGRARKGTLPEGMSWPKKGEILCFGWSINELDDEARAEVLKRVQASLRVGGSLVLLEPLSRRISPWWGSWLRALSPLGVVDHDVKARVALPQQLRDLDRAAGLDHQELGARLMISAGG